MIDKFIFTNTIHTDKCTSRMDRCAIPIKNYEITMKPANFVGVSLQEILKTAGSEKPRTE